jgi:hypothetical protein
MVAKMPVGIFLVNSTVKNEMIASTCSTMFST